MTRKDYALIAQALNQAKVEMTKNPIVVAVHQQIVRTLADSLQNANTNFNRARFLEAAGGL